MFCGFRSPNGGDFAPQKQPKFRKKGSFRNAKAMIINKMIILASTSPRRRELLEKLGIEFLAVAPGSEEEKYKGQAPSDYCMSLSSKKAASVVMENDGDIVIAADTVVAINGKVLGKPADRKEAFNMLKMLSGNEHKVYTGFTIKSKEKTYSAVSRTKVIFRNLTDDVINDYLATGEYADKAGAYAIQGYGTLLVESIEGSYDNVVGLPVSYIFHELQKHFGYKVFKEIKKEQDDR